MSVYTLELPGLKTRQLGRPCFHFSVVESTQEVLRNLARQKAEDGTTVLADEQINGKGRLGRAWTSLKGSQILASILLAPRIPPSLHPLVNLATALSIASALERYGIKDVGIKWPNDVYVNGRKIAGILSELDPIPGRSVLLVGFGINVDGKENDLPKELRDTAITVEMLHPSPDRLIILSLVLNRLEFALDNLTTTLNDEISIMQKEFADRWIYRGKKIAVSTSSNLVEGTADEIDRDGALLLKRDDGKTHRILSGDVVQVQSR